MDVNNELDYKEMVQKIHNTVGDSTVAMKISVDMKHVEKLPSNAHSGDEESSASDEDQVSSIFFMVMWIISNFLCQGWHTTQISFKWSRLTSCLVAPKAHKEIQEYSWWGPHVHHIKWCFNSAYTCNGAWLGPYFCTYYYRIIHTKTKQSGHRRMGRQHCLCHQTSSHSMSATRISSYTPHTRHRLSCHPLYLQIIPWTSTHLHPSYFFKQ